MGKDKIEIQKQRKAIIDNCQRKIKELRNEKQQLQTEIEEINKKLNDAMIEDFNFKGKYINIPNYGSMFVTSEWVNSDLDEVCLRGITFDIQSELEYLDEFHMFVDGWDLWAIPMHRMIDLIQEDTVVVLNKEDFLKDCHQAIEAFSNKMDGLFAPNIKGENE
jgi:hypothetical protein